MEVHAAPAVGKRMWSYVLAAFLMMRKGVLSNKRKLLLAMHLRRNKAVVARTLAALLSNHGHGSHGSTHALRRRDYEFSCTNTPDPNSGRSRRAYFPCLGAVAAHEDYDQYGGTLSLPDAEPPVARIDHYASAASPGLQLLRDLDLAPGEAAESEPHELACASPALVPPPGAAGRFSVRVSNYSSEDDEAGSGAVDDDAEEFIRRFYDQLRRQNTIAMLPYDMHYEPISAA